MFRVWLFSKGRIPTEKGRILSGFLEGILDFSGFQPLKLTDRSPLVVLVGSVRIFRIPGQAVILAVCSPMPLGSRRAWGMCPGR